MKRKLISLMTAVTMLMSLISAMPLTASAADVSASSIKLGDYLALGEYNGEKLLWRCVAFEKATRQADGSVVIDSTQTNATYQAVGKNEGDVGYLPLMFADAIIGKKAFDADGGKTTGSHGRGKGRTDRGSSYWGDSNIRDWLNSADTTVSYSCGNAPEYKNEAGFLTNFNSAEKAAIQTVTQKAIISKCDWEVLDASKRSGYEKHNYTTTPVKDIVQNYSSAYSEQISDKMFLLDVQQLYNASVALGSYYIPSADTQYLLRTPCCNTDHSARYVLSSGGSLDVYSAYNSTYGIRPAFFLDLSSVEFDGGDGAKETPHTIPVPPHYHSLTHYDAVLPTCTETGKGEYWKCEGDEGCGKYFSDENGTTEISEIPTVNATGHSWGGWRIATAPTETTTGTAERACVNNPNHTENVDLPVLTDTAFWEVGARVEPTETTDGSQIYTSKYGSVTVVLPATGPGSFSVRYEGGKAIVTASKAGTYAVIFAAYDGSDRLMSLSAQTVTVEKGETPVAPINFTAGGTVKVILWRSLTSMKPLCEAGGN